MAALQAAALPDGGSPDPQYNPAGLTSDRKHIAVLTREYPPEVYGGAGTHVEYLVRELRQLLDVTVHALGSPRDEPHVESYKPWEGLSEPHPDATAPPAPARWTPPGRPPPTRPASPPFPAAASPARRACPCCSPPR